MADVPHRSLYEISPRVWLSELTRRRHATLDDIPDAELDRIAAMGFDWVWLLGVWQTGAAGRRISQADLTLRKQFQESLPDLHEEDICGSSFAITSYTVHRDLGGDEALTRLRRRLGERGLRLMLDFVPNHTALDHPWVEQHPEYYVRGSEEDLARAPVNYTRLKHSSGNLILAHGRDPNFPAWTDTLQLNYGNPATQRAMGDELMKIASYCDGVRCDMAMLLLPDVFERTWGIRTQPFWPEIIRRVRVQRPDFCFLAEVYWDLEWTLQEQGFDYTYDKRLYDRLRAGHARPVREHLQAGLEYQSKLVRFLENHDEPRAAAVFPDGMHQAAAVVSYLAPGLCFFHQGQLEGRRKRVSPHLSRAQAEPPDQALMEFYHRLLQVLRHPVVRTGQWQLLECLPSSPGNTSHEAFIAYSWQHQGSAQSLVAVNYSAYPSQCWLQFPFADLGGHQWFFHDLLEETSYERAGNDLESRGLYLDLPPWTYHILAFTKTNRSGA